MMDIKVRQAKKEDIDRICEIDRKSFNHLWARGTFEADLEDEMKAIWVAESDGKILGYLDAFVLPSVNGEILRIATDPEYRKQRVAHNLLNFMLCYCNLIAAEKMLLEVNSENEAAIALYKSFDFKEDGRREKYYDGKYDAILMSRTVSLESRVLQLDIEDGLYD